MLGNSRWTVIGIFEEQDTAKQALEDLRTAGFNEDQLGFVFRDGVPVVSRTEISAEENASAFKGGIVGGILGAADALLTPVLGPSVANTIPGTLMPIAEQSIDRVQNAATDDKQSVVAEHMNPEMVNSDAEQDTIKMVPVKPDMANNIETRPTEPLVVAQIQTEQQNVQAEQEVQEVQEAQPSERRLYEEEATGAFTGGVVGGVLGAAVALLIPVLGPIFAGGILVTIFSAALGAVTGGFLGAFIAIGVPEEQAHRYEQEFRAGRTIVTVKTEDRQQYVLDIFYRNNVTYANAHDAMHATV